MKTQAMFYLDAEVLSNIRNKAASLGMPYSVLADLLLKDALGNVSDEEIRTEFSRQLMAKQAAIQERAKTRQGAQTLKPSESAALASLTPGWADFDDLKAKTGRGDKVLWRALHALQDRGLAEGMDTHFKDAYRGGISTVSKWRLRQQ